MLVCSVHETEFGAQRTLSGVKGSVRLKPNFMNPLNTIDEFKIRRKK
jgi:hypothetical protein